MGFIVGEKVSDVLTLLLSQVGVNPSVPNPNPFHSRPNPCWNVIPAGGVTEVWQTSAGAGLTPTSVHFGGFTFARLLSLR